MTHPGPPATADPDPGAGADVAEGDEDGDGDPEPLQLADITARGITSYGDRALHLLHTPHRRAHPDPTSGPTHGPHPGRGRPGDQRVVGELADGVLTCLRDEAHRDVLLRFLRDHHIDVAEPIALPAHPDEHPGEHSSEHSGPAHEGPPDAEHAWTMWHPMYAAALTVALAHVVLHDGPWARWMSWGPLVWIGGLGYGIYLIHEPVLRFLGSLGLYPEPGPGWAWLAVSAMVAVPSVLLAWVSARTVEPAGLRLLATMRSDGSPRDYYDHLDPRDPARR